MNRQLRLPLWWRAIWCVLMPFVPAVLYVRDVCIKIHDWFLGVLPGERASEERWRKRMDELSTELAADRLEDDNA